MYVYMCVWVGEIGEHWDKNQDPTSSSCRGHDLKETWGLIMNLQLISIYLKKRDYFDNYKYL